tara:strand:- start:48 stop:230 length:183 start_codon:yes stop_codon:yes gene_type:complete
MIIEAIFGLVLNVMVADNATGQTITKGILMYNKIDKGSKSGVEEELHQYLKDSILEQGEK